MLELYFEMNQEFSSLVSQYFLLREPLHRDHCLCVYVLYNWKQMLYFKFMTNKKNQLKNN